MLKDNTWTRIMGFWHSDKKSIDENKEGVTSMSDATIIDFGETLDISFAAKLHAQLKDEVKSNSTVKFISSELTRIDASCLQVLSSFMGYAKENEIEVVWDDAGDVIKEASHLTGLTEVLGLSN